MSYLAVSPRRGAWMQITYKYFKRNLDSFWIVDFSSSISHIMAQSRVHIYRTWSMSSLFSTPLSCNSVKKGSKSPNKQIKPRHIAALLLLWLSIRDAIFPYVHLLLEKIHLDSNVLWSFQSTLCVFSFCLDSTAWKGCVLPIFLTVKITNLV